MMTFMLFLLSPDTFWHLKVVSLKWCCRCSCCCCVDDIGLNYNRIWFTYFCFFAALQLLWSLLRRYLPLLLFYTFSHNGGYYLTSLFCFSPLLPISRFFTPNFVSVHLLFLFSLFFVFANVSSISQVPKWESMYVCVFVCTTKFLC